MILVHLNECFCKVYAVRSEDELALRGSRTTNKRTNAFFFTPTFLRMHLRIFWDTHKPWCFRIFAIKIIIILWMYSEYFASKIATVVKIFALSSRLARGWLSVPVTPTWIMSRPDGRISWLCRVSVTIKDYHCMMHYSNHKLATISYRHSLC